MYEWMSHLKKGYTPEIIEILTCSLPVFLHHNSESVYACGTDWRLGVVWTVISSWDPKENYSVQIIVNPGRSHLVAHLAEFNIHVKTRLLLNSECLQTATPYTPEQRSCSLLGVLRPYPSTHVLRTNQPSPHAVRKQLLISHSRARGAQYKKVEQRKEALRLF